MRIKIYLEYIRNLVITSNLPNKNKKKLLEGYEKLNKILEPSFTVELLSETISALKVNPLYKQFELLQFFKIIINKVDNIDVLDALTEESQGIFFSKREEQIIDQRLYLLTFLSILGPSTDEAEKSAEDENLELEQEEQLKELTELTELTELKEIYHAKVFTVSHAKSFFCSFFFQCVTSDYVNQSDILLQINLKDLYQTFLKKAKINTEEDFISHEKVLREKKEDAAKKGKSFDYSGFFSILEEKKSIVNYLQRLGKNDYTFYTLPEAKPLSPTARAALYHNLQENHDKEHERILQSRKSPSN
jgi:hypothetical protein